MGLTVSPTAAMPTEFYSHRFLKLSFPVLELWVVQSVSFPSCSSWFIHTPVRDHPVLQLQPCLLCLGCPSLSLLPVWINVSSSTPSLSDFHTVWFSGSSDCFFVFKLVLLLLVWESEVYLLTPPSWPEVPLYDFVGGVLCWLSCINYTHILFLPIIFFKTLNTFVK